MVLIIVLFFFSGLIDIWCFFRITKIKVNGVLFALVAILNFTIGFLIYLGNWGVILANIFEIFLFVLFFRKKATEKLVFGSILCVIIFDLLIDMISSIFLQITNLYSLLSQSILKFALLLLMLVLIGTFSKRIYGYLTDKNSKIFLGLLIYIYVSSLSVSLIYLYTKAITPLSLFFSLYILVQALFAIFIYHEIRLMQERILEKKEQEQLRQRQQQLQEYADYLEKSEDDLRAFRHDYKNILNSLKVSAQEGNVQDVVQKLNKYTETNLNSEALLKYKDVNHIHVRSIKSIFITKMAEMYNLNIPYNFECRNDIRELPEELDEFDLVRIIGITLDNAIEESKSLIAKENEASAAAIQIMVYSNGTDDFEYEIRNKVIDREISTQEIQKRGFTTKKNHKGLGLANIKELETKYPDMSVSYMIEDGWFDFYMAIDTEEDESE